MFSIIIPAHNEEKYIEETLSHIQKLLHPKDSFEVIVIENGSTDNTHIVAKKFEGKHIRIFTTKERGVSRAKNFGVKHISSMSKWIIFLDADTILKPAFLTDLERHLQKNSDKNLMIGTTTVKPHENKSWYAFLWMKFYDLAHKYTKTSYAIQIMSASLKDKVRFNEEISLAEDLELIQDCLDHGSFFHFNTSHVFTSTRRFEKVGWTRLFIKWTYDAFMYKFRNIKPDYPVIR